MTWRQALVGGFLAATALAVGQPALAAILKGYTDLYVTEMQAGYYQYGADSQSDRWRPCEGVAAGPCAKTRFSFEYDTAKPPHEMRTGLRLLATYYGPDSTGFPTRDIDGQEYLPLPPDSIFFIEAFYPQLGPDFAPDTWGRGYTRTRFAVGEVGEAFQLEFAAEKAAGFSNTPCSPEEEWYANCWNAEGQRPGDEGAVGPFLGVRGHFSELEDFSIANTGTSHFQSRSDYFAESAFEPGLGRVDYVTYAFDNDPANWVDGAPQALIWIVEAPEPGSLSLLGVGLAALAAAARGARRRG